MKNQIEYIWFYKNINEKKTYQRKKTYQQFWYRKRFDFQFQGFTKSTFNVIQLGRRYLLFWTLQSRIEKICMYLFELLNMYTERNTGSWWRYLDPTENYFPIDNKRILSITIKKVITSVQIRYNLFTSVQTNYTTANREFVRFAHS